MLVTKMTILQAAEKLGVQGAPNFLTAEYCTDICNVLSVCDSFLEIKAFIGACYYIQGSSFLRKNTVGYYPVHYAELGKGIVITNSETWMKNGMGYYNIIIVPQFITSKNHNYLVGESVVLTHDFAVFVPKMVTRIRDRFHMLCAVEIDGYAVHSKRREKDAYRDRDIGYPVVRILEENENLLKWFRYIDPGHPECKVLFREANEYNQVI